MIYGYKCFHSGLVNNYGRKFEVGKCYNVLGNISFGNNGNGFHMCINIEDTFRYFDSFNEDICICEVKGTGSMVKFNDEYNEYYNMYSVQNIEIVRELSREEIIQIGLNIGEIRVIRFIQGYKLTEEEIKLFKDKFKSDTNVMCAIEYYQYGNKEIYSDSYKKLCRRNL